MYSKEWQRGYNDLAEWSAQGGSCDVFRKNLEADFDMDLTDYDRGARAYLLGVPSYIQLPPGRGLRSLWLAKVLLRILGKAYGAKDRALAALLDQAAEEYRP